VKLVACSHCHAQYDVSQVLAETLHCVCGSEVPNRPPKAVDAVVQRCSGCGALVPPEARDCGFCGAAVVRDFGPASLICPECYARNDDGARFCVACGVGFRPQSIQVDTPARSCPVCAVLMPGNPIAGLALNECPSCRGVWAPGESFERLVGRAVELQRGAQSPIDPRTRRGTPSGGRPEYRRCPDCDQLMSRRNYRKSSGVILDVCNDHGTWLDADELEQIAGFLLSGGATAEFFAQEKRSVSAAQATARRWAQKAAQTAPAPADRGLGGLSLLDLLNDILS